MIDIECKTKYGLYGVAIGIFILFLLFVYGIFLIIGDSLTYLGYVEQGRFWFQALLTMIVIGMIGVKAGNK